MNLSSSVVIERPPEKVWNVITDFKNCSNFITSIVKVEILNQPKDSLLGFKWKETRVMFGKEATEIMWITDYVENKYYQARAESHGSIYKSRLAVEQVDSKTKLSMSFTAESTTFFAKVFSFLMGWVMKGSMEKAINKDLMDIKTYLESS